jgi:hypothetical protein
MPALPQLSSFDVKVGNTVFKVGSSYFQFDFSVTSGTVEEVIQNVANTFFVRKGTQRLQRTFGLDMTWIDMPGNLVTLQGGVAILRDISYWEPRAVFKQIDFQLDTVSMLSGVFKLYLELDVNMDQQISNVLYEAPSGKEVWTITAPYDGTANTTVVGPEEFA